MNDDIIKRIDSLIDELNAAKDEYRASMLDQKAKFEQLLSRVTAEEAIVQRLIPQLEEKINRISEIQNKIDWISSKINEEAKNASDMANAWAANHMKLKECEKRTLEMEERIATKDALFERVSKKASAIDKFSLASEIIEQKQTALLSALEGNENRIDEWVKKSNRLSSDIDEQTKGIKGISYALAANKERLESCEKKVLALEARLSDK